MKQLAALVIAVTTAALADAQSTTALVRHSPTLNGTVEGTIQQMTAESVTLNGGAIVTEDLLVPGTPTLRLNGNPTFGGTLVGSGATSPMSHTVTLNGNARLRYLRSRTDAPTMPTVAAPPSPVGMRSVSINSTGQSPGDFATLRNLTLNGNVGQFAVPAGVYGDFTANGDSGFTLGVAGATTPAVYAFQRLTLNGNSQFNVVGPVTITVANSVALSGSLVGNSVHPAWLILKLSSGGLTLNSQVTLYGTVAAPNGTVTINGQSLLAGGLISDRLTVNGGGTLRLLAPPSVNQPPSVTLSAPVGGTLFVAPATITLAATASDADGTVAKVQFYQGTTLIGELLSAPHQFIASNLAPGSYTFKARAVDNAGASTESASVTITVGANQPPTIGLTSPANGATYTAPAAFTLVASAADSDGTVNKVEFFSGPTKLGESTTAPYQFPVSNLGAGTHLFTARATDSGNASTVSAQISLTVIAPPNQPPTITLTAPAAGTNFFAPATITLAANATDRDGTITQVEFFQGATNLGATTVAPFQFTVSSLIAGNYTFKARATDNAGATADSSPLNLSVTGVNLPPVITLTAPASGSLFNVPATIALAATASDPDGTIAKVEFFQGASKLGESAVAPFTLTWIGMLPGSYALSAKATDNQGAATSTTASVVTVQAALPYMTDFESAEGYVLGALHDQGGWIATNGASLTAADRSGGLWSVQLPANATATQVSRTFPGYSGQPIVFIDVFAKLVATPDRSNAGGIQAEGAKVILVKTGSVGELQAFHGDGAGGGQWIATGHTVALTAENQSAAWLRLTLREDFTAKKWDLYAGGKMVAYDLGFTDNSTSQVAHFTVTGAEEAPTLFDALLIGFENPLFVDADQDGLDDAWEIANGLNPSINDRNSDADGDGFSAVAEYRTGTSPKDYFNGITPMIETLNGGGPGPDDALAMVVRRPDGTPWPNAPVVFEITSGERRISTIPGGPDFSSTVTVRTDAQGVARVYLEAL